MVTEHAAQEGPTFRTRGMGAVAPYLLAGPLDSGGSMQQVARRYDRASADMLQRMSVDGPRGLASTPRKDCASAHRYPELQNLCQAVVGMVGAEHTTEPIDRCATVGSQPSQLPQEGTALRCAKPGACTVKRACWEYLCCGFAEGRRHS